MAHRFGTEVLLREFGSSVGIKVLAAEYIDKTAIVYLVCMQRDRRCFNKLHGAIPFECAVAKPFDAAGTMSFHFYIVDDFLNVFAKRIGVGN